MVLIILAPKRSIVNVDYIFYKFIWTISLFLKQTNANLEEIASIQSIIFSSSLELSSRVLSDFI